MFNSTNFKQTKKFNSTLNAMVSLNGNIMEWICSVLQEASRDKKMGNPRRETAYTFAQGKATSMADLSLLYYYRETTVYLLLSFQKLHLSRVEGYCI